MLIEVYADIACPWCYVADKRLQKALASRPDLKVERHWRPFQLQPDLPQSGLEWNTFAADKFGGWERAQAMFGYVSQAAEGDGLEFNFDRIASAANTANGHRLILWAAEQGQEWEMAHALFKAFFTDGRDLSNRAELAAIAGEVGLEPETAYAFLKTDRFEAEVDYSQQRASELGIRGVPFFIFEGKYAVSGAQPVESYQRAIEMVEKHKREKA
jgi:predicted DsbA family dithiol-disulfide isomerase